MGFCHGKGCPLVHGQQRGCIAATSHMLRKAKQSPHVPKLLFFTISPPPEDRQMSGTSGSSGGDDELPRPLHGGYGRVGLLRIEPE
jgi:hypothetical protein